MDKIFRRSRGGGSVGNLEVIVLMMMAVAYVREEDYKRAASFFEKLKAKGVELTDLDLVGGKIRCILALDPERGLDKAIQFYHDEVRENRCVPDVVKDSAGELIAKHSMGVRALEDVGLEKMKTGDYAGAITEFNEAITISLAGHNSVYAKMECLAVLRYKPGTNEDHASAGDAAAGGGDGKASEDPVAYLDSLLLEPSRLVGKLKDQERCGYAGLKQFAEKCKGLNSQNVLDLLMRNGDLEEASTSSARAGNYTRTWDKRFTFWANAEFRESLGKSLPVSTSNGGSK